MSTGIGHGLEGVEGDADGQGQLQHRHGDADVLQGSGYQIPILEEEQDGQVQSQGEAHRPPCPFVVAFLLAAVDDDAGEIVQHNGEDHQQDIHRLAPAVKQQVEHQQHKIAQLQGGDIVEKQYGR